MPIQSNKDLLDAVYMSITLFTALRTVSCVSIMSSDVSILPYCAKPQNSNQPKERCFLINLSKQKNDPEGKNKKELKCYVPCICCESFDLKVQSDVKEKNKFLALMKKDVNTPCPTPCPFGILKKYWDVIPDNTGEMRLSLIKRNNQSSHSSDKNLQPLRFFRAMTTIRPFAFLETPMGNNNLKIIF